jgi:hypothetical protein
MAGAKKLEILPENVPTKGVGKKCIRLVPHEKVKAGEEMAKAVIGLAVFALALSACGGGASSTLNQCTSVAPPQLVYPASGATGVPSNFNLWVSYPQNPSITFGPPVLTPPSTSFSGSVTGGPWSTPPVGATPPPLNTLPGNPQWVSSIASLNSATTYSISVTNTACNQKYTLGSFTTQ